MSDGFTEFEMEEAALAWLSELGYAVEHGANRAGRTEGRARRLSTHRRAPAHAAFTRLGEHSLRAK